MRHIKARIHAEGPPEALRLAQHVARSIVSPSDGYASYDITRMIHLDAQGNPTMAPTGELEVHYTYWRSDRRGRYALQSKAAKPPAVPGFRDALNLLFGGHA